MIKINYVKSSFFLKVASGDCDQLESCGTVPSERSWLWEEAVCGEFSALCILATRRNKHAGLQETSVRQQAMLYRCFPRSIWDILVLANGSLLI